MPKTVFRLFSIFNPPSSSSCFLMRLVKLSVCHFCGIHRPQPISSIWKFFPPSKWAIALTSFIGARFTLCADCHKPSRMSVQGENDSWYTVTEKSFPSEFNFKSTIYFKNIIITAGGGTDSHILLGKHSSASAYFQTFFAHTFYNWP